MKTTTPYADLLPPLSSEEYAALRASIEAGGVRDPVVVDEAGNILDGHHRYSIDPNAPRRVVSGLSEPEKRAFVFAANLTRRNLSPEQKRDIRGRMKAVALDLRRDGQTEAGIAAKLGVSQQAVAKWFASNGNGHVTTRCNVSTLPDCRVKVPPQQRPVVAQRVAAGEAVDQVAADFAVAPRTIRRIATQEQRQQEAVGRRVATAASVNGDASGLHLGDFRELGGMVVDASVDLIFTDPPYLSGDIPIFGDLGRFAARVLKPGGWCVAYAGIATLPEILCHLGEHLTYGWCFHVGHSGGQARFRTLRVYNTWKPVVGFYKPPLEVYWGWFRDTVSGGREKGDHPWQQAQGEAEHFVRALSPAGGLVVDPFCGSGTTPAACIVSGRRWVAFEIDAETHEKAVARITAAREAVA